LPLSRGERRDVLLHERNPDLEARLIRDRQAKIDSITLHNKYQDVDNWASSSFRGQSFDEDLPSPSFQRARRRSSREGHSGAPSPALRGKAAVQELGTSIDEEAVLDLGRPAMRLSEQTTEPALSKGLTVGSPPPDVWYDSRGKQLSPATATPNQTPSTKPPGAKSPTLRPSPAQTTGIGAAPWAASQSPGTKLDMKDIMSQASNSRVSSLTQGIAASRRDTPTETLPSPVIGSKMSQKERKKMLQQHQPSTPEVVTQMSSESLPIKSLPWQIASARKPSSDLTMERA